MNQKEQLVLLIGASIVGLIGIYLFITKQKNTIQTPTGFPNVNKNATQSGLDQAKNILGAGAAAISAGKNIASTIGGLLKGAGATEGEALIASKAAETATTDAVLSGATAEEAATAGTTAATETLGVSGLTGGLIGAGALALIFAIAWAWGVFDPWNPNAGFQLLHANEKTAAVAGVPVGTIVKIPDSIFDQMNADHANADVIMGGFLAKIRSENEAKQAAITSNQNAIDAAQAIENEQQRLAEVQRQLDIQSALAATAAQQQAAADLQRQLDAQIAAAQQQADYIAQQTSEAYKQNTSTKVFGNSGTQYNFESIEKNFA